MQYYYSKIQNFDWRVETTYVFWDRIIRISVMFNLDTAPAIYQYLSVLVHLFKYFILTFYYSHSTRLLAATTLRNVLGTKNLAEILSERETISQVMQNALDEATDPWGVKVIRNDHITL